MFEGAFELGNNMGDESEYISQPVSGINTANVSYIAPLNPALQKVALDHTKLVEAVQQEKETDLSLTNEIKKEIQDELQQEAVQVLEKELDSLE